MSPRTESKPMDRNFLIILRGGERFIWIYDDQHAPRLAGAIAKAAADPRLSFTWSDAADAIRTVTDRMRARRAEL